MPENSPTASTVSPRGRAIEFLLSLLGSLVIAFEVPWRELLTTWIPSGGDNPAHPVLMMAVRDALLHHGSIVHYSYHFWAGFELFQFYFPLPYVAGGLLSTVIHPFIAFKLTTVIGSILLPMALYFMARGMGLSMIAGIVAELCGIAFLYTDVHRMWGGNVFSALAGMIGNSWTFIFVPLAIGELFRARRAYRFSPAFALLAAAAALSHFYGFLLLLQFVGVFVLLDLVEVLRGRVSVRQLLPFFASGVAAVALIAWWFIPLIVFKPFSSDFGGNWGVSLWATTRWAERIFFAVACLGCLGLAATSRFRDRTVLAAVLFAALSLLLFFSNKVLTSTAFIDVRLWPQVYFSMFLLVIVLYGKLEQLLPPQAFALLLCPLWFFIPTDKAFLEARSWARWNFEGIEMRPGGAEFADVVQELNRVPPSRVSFESNDTNNGTFGSVRAFELLPLLTRHEIVEGGIVNSATYSGVGYFLQCLTSASCAGWPPGTIPPGKDIPRAIDMMRALGVGYHIASSREIAAEFEKSGELDKLYQGQYLTLFRLRSLPRKVEVFDAPLPVVQFDDPLTTLVNLPRYDRARNAGLIYDTRLVPTAEAEGERISWRRFSAFLLREWYHGERVGDRGWEARRAERQQFANGFLLSWSGPVRLERQESYETFVADRGFDPDVFRSDHLQTPHELALPLFAVGDAAEAKISYRANGYAVSTDGQELPQEGEVTIPFPPTRRSRVVRFTSAGNQRYRYLDVERLDERSDVGLPGEGEVHFPDRITERCGPLLVTEFHRMTLRTKCPGKPHLIKYSYYPKWRADVPISLATNNFMALTPRNEETVLEHRRAPFETFASAISGATLLGIVGGTLFRRRARKTERSHVGE